jgi:hypothetical protein
MDAEAMFEIVIDFGNEYVVLNTYRPGELTLVELNVEVGIAKNYLGVKKVTLQHVTYPSRRTVVMSVWEETEPKPISDEKDPHSRRREALKDDDKPPRGSMWLMASMFDGQFLEVQITVLNVYQTDFQWIVMFRRCDNELFPNGLRENSRNLEFFLDHVVPVDGDDSPGTPETLKQPEIGSRWIWEADKPWAREHVVVTNVYFAYGKWMVITNRADKGFFSTGLKECSNTLSRFWEAVTPKQGFVPTDSEEFGKPEIGSVWLWDYNETLIRVKNVTDDDGYVSVTCERTDGKPVEPGVLQTVDFELSIFWQHMLPSSVKELYSCRAHGTTSSTMTEHLKMTGSVSAPAGLSKTTAIFSSASRKCTG